jgi:T4-like virus Myoviridae tail sheath stabiliser
MLGTYYYHEIIRKTIISFGTLFNQIHIRHQESNGNNFSDTRVPIAYGPRQKFLARIVQQPELNKPIQITLPRMSFEMVSIQYDPTRKSSVVQTFKACDNGGNIKKVFMPVPYNIGFELNILTKLNDDALQIIEQILPYFQPAFNLTIDLVDSIGEKRDIPMVLDSISFQDDYEGDFSTRRALIYTLSFTAKTYLFGPVAESTDGLIRKVQVDLYTNTDTATAKREVRYTVTPDPYDANPDDNFGFDENWEFLGDSKEFSPTRKLDL